VATYPTAVYAPASKSAGQTIQPSFFNDPDAEITAVQDGLKNGLQHNLSVVGTLTVAGATTISTGGLSVSTGSVNIGGPSSLATLNVSGGSTLAGLTVTSTASFASSVTVGSLTVTGALTAGSLSQTIPSVRLTLAADLTFALGGAEFCPSWTTQEWSVGGMHSTTTNSSRITFAHSTGLYQIGMTSAPVTGVNSGAAGLTQLIRFRYNDTSALGGAMVLQSNVGGLCPANVTDVVRIASTADFVTVRISMTDASVSTGRYVPAAASSIAVTSFWAVKVG
jgi:hypothetical protein